MKKGLIIASIIVFVFGLIFLILGVCLCGGDWNKLASETFEEMTFEKTSEEVSEINNAKLDIAMGNVIVKKGDNLKIDYIENDNTTNTIEVLDGNLNFTQNRKWFMHIGVNVGFNMPKDIVVTLPNDNIPLDINIKNGVVIIEDGEFKNLNIKTNNGKVVLKNSTFLDSIIETDNGKIEIDNCNFGTLSVESDNGAIEIENVEAQSITSDIDNGAIYMNNVVTDGILNNKTNNGKIELVNCIAQKISGETDNGQIVLNRVTANDYKFTINNGSISGSIVGVKSEYNISVDKDHGKSNLSNASGSTNKMLDLTIDNGNINITFVS